MFARFLQGKLGPRCASWLADLTKGPALHPVRWGSGIVVLMVAVTALVLLSRRDSVSAAGEESPRFVQAAQANSVPAAPARDHEPSSRLQEAGTSTAGPDTSALQTIGALGAAHLFQAYLSIGLIADGKDKGTYTDEDARKVLKTVLSLVDSVDRQLEAFGKAPLEKEDRDSLEQMRAISALLREQGSTLQTYWDSFQNQDAGRYESLRSRSYAAISKLLAIAP
jgi:hypothetical protein